MNNQRSLQEIGESHNCDKFTVHRFGKLYERHLGLYRDSDIKLLEIGIGGEDYEVGGASLLTWQAYFSKAQVHGIDIYDKSTLNTPRIKTSILDQRDQDGLKTLWLQEGGFDVIIDDGSHKTEDTLLSFFGLFNLMRPGGVYVIEDLQTGYWPSYGGTSIAQSFSNNTIEWIKTLIDCLNRNEILWPSHPAIASGFLVDELHVYRNIAFVVRGDTPLASNVLTEDLRQLWLLEDAQKHGVTLSEALKINNPFFRARLLTMVLAAIRLGEHNGG